jgi:hypothetical protein
MLTWEQNNDDKFHAEDEAISSNIRPIGFYVYIPLIAVAARSLIYCIALSLSLSLSLASLHPHAASKTFGHHVIYLCLSDDSC